MAMAYATGDDFLKRYDVRLIGDLVNDDGNQEPTASLPQNETLLEMLADAASEITVVLRVGDRYTSEQLTNLDDDSANYLRRLNCDLALIMLKRRRGVFNAEKDGKFDEANKAKLKALKDGDVYLQTTLETEPGASTLQLDAPKIVPVLRRQTIRNRTKNYYPASPIPSQDFPQ